LILLIDLVEVLVYATLTFGLLLELNSWIQLNCHLIVAFNLSGPLVRQRLFDRHLLVYSCFLFTTIILSIVASVNSVLAC